MDSSVRDEVYRPADCSARRAMQSVLTTMFFTLMFTSLSVDACTVLEFTGKPVLQNGL